jgi:hypothetical protein
MSKVCPVYGVCLFFLLRRRLHAVVAILGCGLAEVRFGYGFGY